MIPVRVPATTRPPEVGGPKHIPHGHPLAGDKCPVCGRALRGTDVVLVVVGSTPEERIPGKAWVTAAAVAVHVRCAFGGAR